MLAQKDKYGKVSIEALTKHDEVFKEIFNLQGVNKEVLNAVKSHISYYGVESSFFSNLSRTWAKTSTIISAVYGGDLSAKITFQKEFDSVLDKIRHDLKTEEMMR